jgi:GNAT superfamily N-acetyltransferase
MLISRYTHENALVLNEFTKKNTQEFLFLNRQMIFDPTNLTVLLAFDDEGNIQGTAAIYYNKSVEFRGTPAAIEVLINHIPSKEKILYVHTYSTVVRLIQHKFSHLSNIHEDLWMARIIRDTNSPDIPYTIVELSEQNRTDIKRLFQKSDPENLGTISDQKMIFSENYIWLGIFDKNQLISVIGATTLKGNLINYLATDPIWRNHGLGTCLINSVFQMIPRGEIVNINVRKSNTIAFKLYKKLGFSIVQEFIALST